MRSKLDQTLFFGKLCGYGGRKTGNEEPAGTLGFPHSLFFILMSFEPVLSFAAFGNNRHAVGQRQRDLHIFYDQGF